MTTSTRGKYMNQNQQDFEQGLDSPCHNFKRHDQLEIALGMKPDFVGKGYGRAFFQAIEDYAKLQFAAKCHVLKVADFNKRAKHLYCQMGYKGVTVYNQKTNGSAYPFVRMEKWFSEKE